MMQRYSMPHELSKLAGPKMTASLRLAGILLLLLSSCTAVHDNNEAASNSVHHGGGGEREGKGGLGSTTALIADMARELITRSYTNSQVLSLNLSNVLILVVLKALLFGAGFFGGGGGSGSGLFGGLWGRSGGPDQQPRALGGEGVTEGELLLALSFLSGERHGGDFGCLHRVACQEPAGRAGQYLAASQLLLKGARVFSSVITVSPKYEKIVSGLEEAVRVGSGGGDCSQYACKHQHL